MSHVYTARMSNFSKNLLLGIALFLPVHPVWANALELPEQSASLVSESVVNKKKRKKQKRPNFIRSIMNGVVNGVKGLPGRANEIKNTMMHVDYLTTPLPVLANAAYGDGPIEKMRRSNFIQPIEKKELLVDQITHYMADNTVTSLGPLAMTNMMNTFDKEHMLKVQRSIQRLAQDDEVYEKVKKNLTQFARYENTFLMYWDPHQKVQGPQPHLFAKAQELKVQEFFRFSPEFSLGAPPFEQLPNPAYLITLLSQLIPLPQRPHARAAGASLRVGSKLLSWFYSILIANNSYSFIRKILFENKFLNPLENARTEFWAALGVTFLFWKTTKYLKELKEKYDACNDPSNCHIPQEMLTDGLIAHYRYIGDSGSYADVANIGYYKYLPPDHGGFFNVCGIVGFLLWDLGHRTQRDLSAFLKSLLGFATLHYTWNTMQLHATDLARCLRLIDSMKDMLAHDDEFKGGIACELLSETLTNGSSHKIRDLMKLAHSPAFVKKKHRGGHALKLHDDMREVAPAFQPVVNAIGYLDAMFAVATCVRNKKGCFVHWLSDEDTHARLDIKNGILPVMKHAKPNSIQLGYDSGNKAVVTGPNGAGKSVFVRMVGANIILAHAFGVGLAEEMSMHWLNLLRSSLDTGESLADDLSRLNAQKMRMDEVINECFYAIEYRDTNKAMFLLDEPLSGTREKIGARQMSRYCNKIKDVSQLMTTMATHNEEPTKFENDGFVNYQVCVEELENGTYRPSFQIKPGIPEWWFSTDPALEEKQDNFVRYTVAQKYKAKLEDAIAHNQPIIDKKLKNLDKQLARITIKEDDVVLQLKDHRRTVKKKKSSRSDSIEQKYTQKLAILAMRKKALEQQKNSLLQLDLANKYALRKVEKELEEV